MNWAGIKHYRVRSAFRAKRDHSPHDTPIPDSSQIRANLGYRPMGFAPLLNDVESVPLTIDFAGNSAG